MGDRLVCNWTRRDSVGARLGTLCSGAKSVQIASAFVLTSGAERLIGILRRHGVPPQAVTVIAGTSFGITQPRALRVLFRAGVRVWLYRGTGTFHPKVYWFERGRRSAPFVGDLLVGSANLSGRGLTWNSEAMLQSRVTGGSSLAKQVRRFFRTTLASAERVTPEVVRLYQSHRRVRPYRETGRVARTGRRPGRRGRGQPARRRRRPPLLGRYRKWRVILSRPRSLEFRDKEVVFTGRFDGLTQAEAMTLTARRGGQCKGHVTGDTKVLVVGSRGNAQYLHKIYGRKIERALDRRGRGDRWPIAIEEGVWRDLLGID